LPGIRDDFNQMTVVNKLNLFFIGRAVRFSPNSADKDASILAAVRHRLVEKAVCVEVSSEEKLLELDMQGQVGRVDGFVSMGRSLSTLAWLEKQQVPVVNSVSSVRLCNRRGQLMRLLEERHVPVPPLTGDDGYWVKRGNCCAETSDDVQYAPDRMAADRLCEAMRNRGISDIDVRAHVIGDLVKFYAVRGTDFFRYYYPGNDGGEKFHGEFMNGEPHHYAFDKSLLLTVAHAAADMAQLDVYGGDCIIRPDGQPVLIDLNDWPSFSHCREEASEAIAWRILQKMEK